MKYPKTTYLDEENVKRLDEWRAQQRPIPSFSDAIQFLMLQGLTNATIVKKDADKLGKAKEGKVEEKEYMDISEEEELESKLNEEMEETINNDTAIAEGEEKT